MNSRTINRERITSIDTLRGLVIILMLLDHTRERLYYHVPISDPLQIGVVPEELFFTRILTHLCAPIFVFLAGVSAWIYASKRGATRGGASSFLFKRGLFIIALELTLINFSWFGNYASLYLQVMWAIGTSMIMLSAISQLPRIAIGVIGVAIVAGHNALGFIEVAPGEWGYGLWTILHDRGVLFQIGDLRVFSSYPILPWIGVISLGYAIAPIFGEYVSRVHRQKRLLTIGCCSLALLCTLRAINIYGDAPWLSYDSSLHTFMSFINFTKYPPSLDFILFTLGVATILLALFERLKPNGLLTALRVYGNAPMFFYIIHLYLLLGIYKLGIMIVGTNRGDLFGVDSVAQVWGITLLLAALLYLPTSWFVQYKRRSRSWWIKYL